MKRQPVLVNLLSPSAAVLIFLAAWLNGTGSHVLQVVGPALFALAGLLLGFRLADGFRPRAGDASSDAQPLSPGPDFERDEPGSRQIETFEDNVVYLRAPAEATAAVEEFPVYLDVLKRHLGLITDVSEDAANLMLSQLSELDQRLEALVRMLQEEQSGNEIGDALHEIESSLDDYQGLIAELAEREQIEAAEAELFRQRLEAEKGTVLAAIDGVNRIARQTTMLSYNVSIEAAHAGDAGAGFTVIGNEIRALAKEVRSLADELFGRVQSTMDWVSSDLLAQASVRERQHRETMDRISTFLGSLSGRLGHVLDTQIVGHHNRIIDQVTKENERLAAPVMAMMGSIQFQDIVRQQVEHIVQMSADVSDYMVNSGVGTHSVDGRARAGGNLSQVLERGARNCVAEMQRAVYRGEDVAVANAAPKIELF